ncbi:MAG: DUF58 domain-containing protein [Pseudomonadota bacterium]
MLKRLQKFLLNRSSYQEKIQLSNRNIYILPTRQGLFFSLILLLMLLTAINFSNSLIFLITFFLASIALVSMLFTQKSLLGLSFHSAIASPVFCKQHASIPLHIAIAQKNKFLPCSLTFKFENFNQTIDVLEQNEALLLSIKTQQRGVVIIPPITVSTTFPLGLFYAWSTLKLTTQSLVYPQPLPSKSIIKSNYLSPLSGHNELQKGMEDFSGLDKYIKGQALKHIHWKAFAKQQGLYTKTFSGGSIADKYWLDIKIFDADISLEMRLSYLCYFILQAEKNGDSYGLKMHQESIAINTGDKHKHQCLRLLALT